MPIGGGSSSGGATPSLSSVLGVGNAMGGHDIIGSAPNSGANAGSFLELDSGSPGTQGGDVTLQGGDGATGERGGNANILGGGGRGSAVAFSQVQVKGNAALGAGGDISLICSAATAGNSNGGSIFLTPGVKFGTGANGGIVLDINTLPTANPGNPGQLYFNAATNALLVSQG